jgi:hypothetical protein
VELSGSYDVFVHAVNFDLVELQHHFRKSKHCYGSPALTVPSSHQSLATNMDRTIELVDRIAEYIVEHDLGFQLGFLIVAMSPASDMDRSKGFVGLVNRITKYIEENDLRLLLGILTVASLLLALFLTIQELYYCGSIFFPKPVQVITDLTRRLLTRYSKQSQTERHHVGGGRMDRSHLHRGRSPSARRLRASIYQGGTGPSDPRA